MTARGSDLYDRTRDPHRALENRLGRDKVLARRLHHAAQEHGLEVVEVEDVVETGPTIERYFEPLLRDWIARPDRGDVSARRRDENDARLRQWRAHVSATGAAASGEIELACECARTGWELTVRIRLPEAEAARAQSLPLISDAHA